MAFRRYFHAAPALFLGVFCVACLLTLSGCRSNYRYATYRARAEKALVDNKLNQARDLYSIIYQRETTADSVNTDRTTWAFYRLGVIAEVLGEIKLAKGYYWGDKIDEGYYQVNGAVEWLAEAGWQHLDAENPPRTLDEILAFEKAGPKKSLPAQEKRKREISLPVSAPIATPLPVGAKEKTHTRTFQRHMTPPRPGTPEPFRVFY